MGVIDAESVLLDFIFAMASMIFILKNSASSISFVMSSTVTPSSILSSRSMSSSIFSFSIVRIRISLFFDLTSCGVESYSKISSDSSIILVTTALLAARFALNRLWCSSAIVRLS